MNERTDNPQLSSDGLARREAILVDAVRLGRRRRGQRRAARVAAIASPLVVAVILAWIGRPNRPQITQVPPPATRPAIGTPATNTDTLIASTVAVRIERIVDDPTIVARYATDHSPPTTARIDDQELFDVLAVANLRGGLATIDGHTRLVLSR